MNFAEVGRFNDDEVLAIFVGLMMGVVYLILFRWIYLALRAGPRSEVSVLSAAGPPHFHDPLARYGVLKKGVELRMVRLPDYLDEEEEPDWSWVLFNVDYASAVAYLCIQLLLDATQIEVLGAPEILAHPNREADPHETVVYLVWKDGTLMTIPVPDYQIRRLCNALQGSIRVVGDAMLPALAADIMRKVESGNPSL